VRIKILLKIRFRVVRVICSGPFAARGKIPCAAGTADTEVPNTLRTRFHRQAKQFNRSTDLAASEKPVPPA
jgi:hypothetical protein